jgi:prevent-host-death family protein
MTQSIEIAEAEAQLDALVDRAAAGEEIVLSHAGRPVARLMPLAEWLPRQPGVRGSWQVPDDLFLEPTDPDDLRAAEGADTDAIGLTRR